MQLSDQEIKYHFDPYFSSIPEEIISHIYIAKCLIEENSGDIQLIETQNQGLNYQISLPSD